MIASNLSWPRSDGALQRLIAHVASAGTGGGLVVGADSGFRVSVIAVKEDPLGEQVVGDPVTLNDLVERIDNGAHELVGDSRARVTL